jgi:MFS superfamily sulfate permease-like transporter
MIYRFDASIVFFNADHFANRVREVIREAGQKPSWFLIDAETIPIADTTGADMIAALHRELRLEGIVLTVASAKGFFRLMLETTGASDTIGKQYQFTSIREGIEAFSHRPDQQPELETSK